jgi:ankyrin repeat protein
MDSVEKRYLQAAFSDLINYEAEDPLQLIDPLAYRTPEGDSCLHIAAGRGDLQAVALLLDAGMDANLRGDLGNTPLHYASRGAHEAVARLLIDRGASPSLRNELGKEASSP